MAGVLVLLILALYRKEGGYLIAATIVHVVNMIAPQVFRPAAVAWFGLSHLLGTIMSKVVLGVIFFTVVTPIAVWRRAMGADALKLKPFKAGRGSVMQERNHTYTAKDLEQPY